MVSSKDREEDRGTAGIGSTLKDFTMKLRSEEENPVLKTDAGRAWFKRRLLGGVLSRKGVRRAKSK